MSNFTKFIKTTPITDDYEISNTVLGLGINGKVGLPFQNLTKKTVLETLGVVYI